MQPLNCNITLKDDTLTLEFQPTPLLLAKVRALPIRRFDPSSSTWKAPHTLETYEALVASGFDVSALPKPTATGYSIDAKGNLLKICVPYSPGNSDLCRRIPDHRMWDQTKKAWYAKATPRNLSYLRLKFPQAMWTTTAQNLYDTLVVVTERRAAGIIDQKARLAMTEDPEVNDYKFGTTPYRHQKVAFLLSRDVPAFALLMEQRTGKSKVIVDTAAYLYARGSIDAVVVLAPNGVKTNWVTDEIPTHMPKYIPWKAVYWSSGAKAKQREQWRDVLDEQPRDRLRWVVVNIEALSSYQTQKDPGELVPVLRKFMKVNRVLLVVDESTRIKKASANRTKATIELGKYAPFRRILSGMPVTQSPLDVYVPFKFLDPSILGFGSSYSFRNHFAIMGGWNGKEIIGYQHLDELQRLVKTHSYRVLRDECLDLPPKRFQKINVELTPQQRNIYNQMRDDMLVQYAGQTITAGIVLTQMIRFQQIVGGFMAMDIGDIVPVPGPNPKMDALMDAVEEEERKVIVWARFRPEISMIAEALRKRFGDASVVEFHGGIGDEDRIRARQSFQDPNSPVRFFVGQQGTGGIGITLTQGKVVIYFSNSFSLEERKQSEDRPEGIGQTESVTFIDLVARDTVDDKKIIPSLRAKQNLATQVTGDNWKEWI